MSERKHFQFALVTLFAAILAGHSSAQFDPPTAPSPYLYPATCLEVAPMPREIGSGAIQTEFSIVPAGGLATTSVPAPPRCAFDVQSNPIVACPELGRDIHARVLDAQQGTFFVGGSLAIRLISNGCGTSDCELVHTPLPPLGGTSIPCENVNPAEAMPPLPRKLVDLIGEFVSDNTDGICIVRFKAPPITSAPVTEPSYPYSILGLRTIRWDETHAGWWVETVREPQPRYASTNGFFRAPLRSEECANPALPQFRTGDSRLCCPAETFAETSAQSEAKANKLSGTWFRETKDSVIALTMLGDEMKICIKQFSGGQMLCVSFTTDYSVTKDGLIHGVITGIDTSSHASSQLEKVVMEQSIKALVELPFSFRTRTTSLGLMVSNARFGSSLDGTTRGTAEFVGFPIGGMYKFSKDGNVPDPKPQAIPVEQNVGESKPQTIVPTPVDTSSQAVPLPPPSTYAPVPMVPPSAADYPNTFSPKRECKPQAATPPTVGVIRYSVTLAPAAPANVPAPAFDAIVGAMGQMLDGNARPSEVGPCQQTILPPPVQAATAFQSMSEVLPPCCAEAKTPKTGLHGTWVRVVGPAVYTIQIASDHLTITIASARTMPDEKVAIESLILTADHHLSRDGTTMVGLITSFDARLEGDASADVDFEEIADELSQIQKAVTDMPFAISLRVYGDSLAIGNVRLPEVTTSNVWLRMNFLGGRYSAAGDKPLPKPKVAKARQSQPVCPVVPQGCCPAGLVGSQSALPPLPPPDATFGIPIPPAVQPNAAGFSMEYAVPITRSAVRIHPFPQATQGPISVVPDLGIPVGVPSLFEPIEAPASGKKSIKKQIPERIDPAK